MLFFWYYYRLVHKHIANVKTRSIFKRDLERLKLEKSELFNRVIQLEAENGLLRTQLKIKFGLKVE